MEHGPASVVNIYSDYSLAKRKNNNAGLYSTYTYPLNFSGKEPRIYSNIIYPYKSIAEY